MCCFFDVINTPANETQSVALKFVFDKTGCLLFSILSVGSEPYICDQLVM